MQRVIAIDWSGAKARNGRGAIALAEVADRRLQRLDAGLDRPEAVQAVLDADAEGGVLVGMDFAFSLPLWYMRDRGYTTVEDLWDTLSREGEGGAEALLDRCDPPFWGRHAKGRPHEAALDCRRTTTLNSAKPVFQIGGAGSVGTGSLRGMPYLRRLQRAGWSIWPFDEPSERMVVEIYTRRLYARAGIAAVRKSSEDSRRAALSALTGFDISPSDLRTASGNEHAFDALTAAIGLWNCVGGKAYEFPVPDAEERLEGMIFPHS